MAGASGFSRYHFARGFREAYGATFSELVGAAPTEYRRRHTERGTPQRPPLRCGGGVPRRLGQLVQPHPAHRVRAVITRVSGAILAVTDQDVMIEFFVGRLGLTLTTDAEMCPGRVG
jgi:hypothetical protein